MTSASALDARTRTPADVVPVDVDEFHRGVVPALLEQNGPLAAAAMAASARRGMTIAVGDSAYTWTLDDASVIQVRPGDPGDTPRANLTPEWFSDLVNNVRSAVAMMISAEPLMERGGIERMIGFEPTLRALIDGRPAYTTEGVNLSDDAGTPIDLGRTFRVDDDPDAYREFLTRAGFLHFKNVFTADEMQALSSEMDHWFAQMHPDDERAWYARVGDEQVCVRVTNTPVDAYDFPFAERLSPIVDALGAGHEYRGSGLLRKPVGVAEGISDLPWHRDCELGMHSYRCTSLTLGTAVTPATPANGQLGVVAGSHRVNMSMFDLGRVDLPHVHPTTDVGDVTVHLSCTLHCATPPVHEERRVTYSTFRLPGDTDELDLLIKQVRDQAGRETYAPG